MGIFTLIAWGRVATVQERGPIRSTKTGSSSRPRPSTAGPERSPAGRRRPAEGADRRFAVITPAEATTSGAEPALQPARP